MCDVNDSNEPIPVYAQKKWQTEEKKRIAYAQEAQTEVFRVQTEARLEIEKKNIADRKQQILGQKGSTQNVFGRKTEKNDTFVAKDLGEKDFKFSKNEGLTPFD